MIIEALTFIPFLLPAPATWAFDDIQPPTAFVASAPDSLTLNVSEQQADDIAASVIYQTGTISYVWFASAPDPLLDRDAAYRRLASEIVSYQTLRVTTGDEDVWDPSSAIEQTLSFLEFLPLSIPLPKPMLLSEQVAIYWDFGDVYAEIDFDGSGKIDAYGNRPGMPEVTLDKLQIADSEGQISFPTQLERVISNPEDAISA